MRISIDIRAIGRQRTGDEAYTLNLVRNLAKIDSKNKYFLLTNTKNKEVLEEIELRISGKNKKLPGNFKIIPITPGNKFFWTFFALPWWLKKNKPEILHVQYITPLVSSKKTKIITTIHDVSFDAYPEFIGKVDLFFMKTLIPLSIKRASKVIAISNFTKNEIIKYHQVSPGKIATILNGGASAEFFQEISEKKQGEIVSKYKLPEKFFFHVGTLQPRKNIPFLLKSFKLFCDKYIPANSEIKDIELILTGSLKQHNADPNIEKELKRIKAENPDTYSRIKFLGYVKNEELPAVLSLAKALVFPSLYEGFGLPAIESMAVGTPLVCGNNSSLPEVSGEAALYFKQGDEKNLAKNLFRVIMDKELRDKIKKRGKEQAERFSWDKCARETLEVYNKVGKQN